MHQQQDHAAAASPPSAPVSGSSIGAAFAAFTGMRTVEPQFLHLTVLPRADSGTPSTRRHFRLGHMIRRIFSSVFTVAYSL